MCCCHRLPVYCGCLLSSIMSKHGVGRIQQQSSMTKLDPISIILHQMLLLGSHAHNRLQLQLQTKGRQMAQCELGKKIWQRSTETEAKKNDKLWFDCYERTSALMFNPSRSSRLACQIQTKRKGASRSAFPMDFSWVLPFTIVPAIDSMSHHQQLHSWIQSFWT